MSESAQALNVSLRHAYNRKLLNRQLHKFLRNKLSVFGMIIMLLILLSCIFYPIFTTLDYKAMDLSIGATLPCAGHLFGTDQLGRDLFLRCMVGGRYSIYIGVTSAVSSAIIGVIIGAVAGYFGGKVDSILIRITELFQTFPELVLNMVLAALLGRSMMNLIWQEKNARDVPADSSEYSDADHRLGHSQHSWLHSIRGQLVFSGTRRRRYNADLGQYYQRRNESQRADEHVVAVADSRSAADNLRAFGQFLWRWTQRSSRSTAGVRNGYE